MICARFGRLLCRVAHGMNFLVLHSDASGVFVMFSRLQDGRIPLHYTACNAKSMEMYSALINAGNSDPTTSDNKGNTVQVSAGIESSTLHECCSSLATGVCKSRDCHTLTRRNCASSVSRSPRLIETSLARMDSEVPTVSWSLSSLS